jgi:predicted small secreted protein
MLKLIVISLFGLMLVACNTVHGVGQDVEKAGQAIKKSTQ